MMVCECKGIRKILSNVPTCAILFSLFNSTCVVIFPAYIDLGGTPGIHSTS